MRTASVFRSLWMAGPWLCAACGGASAASGPAPAAPASSASPAAAAGRSTPTDEPPEPVALPSACADPSAALCAPPGDFVERLCARPHQELALALFGKTPFTRLYLRGRFDELVTDEEVIGLRFHGVAKGGIQVGSAAGSYDVLRWDGSCSKAVDAEILGKNRPPAPRAARVMWHRIGEPTQIALIAGSDSIKKAHTRRGKECQGAATGDVSLGCQKADAALVDAIVEYVRGGGAVPTPEAP